MLKAVAVVLLLLGVVSIPISIVGEIYLSRRVFGNSRTEMFGGAFEDSLIFSNLFSKRIGQLAEYIELKNVLETDGELDYNRIVCDMEEDGTLEIYSIGDLLRRNHFLWKTSTASLKSYWKNYLLCFINKNKVMSILMLMA